MTEKTDFWDNIYLTKNPDQVSWTQEIPKTSLGFIRGFQLPKTANIIDIGGGDSKLVDFLLDENYENISVLDISKQALERAKKRLGSRADKVKWLVQDITEFKSDTRFDLWHDRAVFHFLTTKEQIASYISAASRFVKTNGYLIMGVFSDMGPEKCSGLPVLRYTEDSLEKELTNAFEKLHCIREDHITPSFARQEFIFCSFRKN